METKLPLLSVDMQGGEDTTVITLRTSQYRVLLIPQLNTLVRDFTVVLRVEFLCIFVFRLCFRKHIGYWMLDIIGLYMTNNAI